jgi:hypothetical protein
MESLKSALADMLQASVVRDVIYYGITLPSSDKKSLGHHLSLTDCGYELLLLTCGFAKKLKNGQVRNNYNNWDSFLHLNLPPEDFSIVQRQYGTITQCKFLKTGQFDESKGIFNAPGIGEQEDKNLPRVRNISKIRKKIRTSVSHVLSPEHFVTEEFTDNLPTTSKKIPKDLLDIPIPHLGARPKSAAAADDHMDRTDRTDHTDHTDRTDDAACKHNLNATTNRGNNLDNAPPSSKSSFSCQLSDDDKFVKAALEERLFPLLFEDDALSKQGIWRAALSFCEAADALVRIVQDLQDRHNKKKSIILRATMMSPKDRLNLPFFEQYGIDRHDKRLVEDAVRDLVTLDIAAKPEHNLLKATLNNGTSTTLVRLPESSTLERLIRNDQNTDFSGKLVRAVLPTSTKRNKAKDNDGEAVLNTEEDAMWAILVLLGKKSGLVFKKAMTTLGYSIGEQMDEISTFAMWASANVNYSQQREIARHLRIWFTKSLVASEIQVKKLLGNNFVAPTTGVYDVAGTTTKVEWSCRDPAALFVHFLTGIMNSQQRKHFTMIDAVVSIDHGKGFSRVVLIFVCRFQCADRSWCEITDTYLCGYAECKKDTRAIYLNTFMPMVNEGVKAIVNSGAVQIMKSAEFALLTTETEQEEAQEFYALLSGSDKKHPLDTELYTPIPVQCFSSADFSQYFTNAGRDGFSSSWCFYCDLSSKEWQVRGHSLGNLWTLAKLKLHRDSLTSKAKPAERKGVLNEPIFDAIDVPNTLPPILHCQLGIVNAAASTVVEEVQAVCEKWTDEYVLIEGVCVWLQNDQKMLRQKRDEYETSNKDRKKGLRAKKKKNLLNEEEMCELANMESFLAYLQAHIKTSTEKLAVAKAKKTEQLDAKKTPENSKQFGQPVRAKMEGVMKEEGIDRGAMFGGDLQGGACRRLMSRRGNIISGWKRELLCLPTEQFQVSEDKIWEVLDLFERLLGHLDALFSICRTKRFHMTNNQLEAAKDHRDQVLALWRFLGMSVTPKLHAIEDHLLEYLTRFGGIGDIGEDEGERGHQIGAMHEGRSRALRDNKAKATAHASWESMMKNEKVQEQMKQVKVEAKRNMKKPPPTETNAQIRKRERDEGRESLLDYGLVNGKLDSLKHQHKKKILAALPKRDVSIWTSDNQWSKTKDEWKYPVL